MGLDNIIKVNLVITKDTFGNANSGPEDQNIPQEPSSDIPDHYSPEKYKYKYNDQKTLNKVINTPVFYKDTQHFKEKIMLKFYRNLC